MALIQFEAVGVPSAKGAKCNSLGQRPRIDGLRAYEALEARNDTEAGVGSVSQIISRFQRFKFRNALVPGPLAQAVTFRAFGAASRR